MKLWQKKIDAIKNTFLINQQNKNKRISFLLIYKKQINITLLKPQDP